MPKSSNIFVTGTDTNVGKTVATYAIGLMLQAQGHDVGVMKPVQCAGHDAQFLKARLNIDDPIDMINPFFLKEPLSPHLAFRRAKQKFDLKKVRQVYEILQKRHDIVLIEGAGGLMAPITENYFNADLAKDLKAPIIIVARLGLGTINHTILTINQARSKKLKILGVLLNDLRGGKQTLVEQTNPREIERITGIPVLGVIPYLS